MNTKEYAVCALIVVLLITAIRYGYQIIKRQITPTPSTWILWVCATSINVATYLGERIEKSITIEDVLSGIYGIADMLFCIAMLLIMFFVGSRTVRFKPFEKWYLFGAGGIILFLIISGNFFSTNILIQALITIGYIPTIHNFFVTKKNTESFTAWILLLIASLISLYPAIEKGNTLSILYSLRAVVSIIIVLWLMAYYSFHIKK